MTATCTLPPEVETRLSAKIEAGDLDLPVLPQAAGEALAACSDENCDLKELSDILHRDPSLAGHILRLANSPLHSPSVPIVSLPQAISRLGISQIKQIAMVVSCETRVFKAEGYRRAVRDCFSHSLATALYAEEIARIRRWNIEECFLGGLLHDVGKPIVLQTLLDLQRELGTTIDHGAGLEAAERHHPRVAALLIRKWGLPENVAGIAENHHVVTQESGTEVHVVALADDFAHAMLETQDVDVESLHTHPRLGDLNLYPDDVDQLIDAMGSIKDKLEAIS